MRAKKKTVYPLLRGGSYYDDWGLRVTYRFRYPQQIRRRDKGFRFVIRGQRS